MKPTEIWFQVTAIYTVIITNINHKKTFTQITPIVVLHPMSIFTSIRWFDRVIPLSTWLFLLLYPCETLLKSIEYHIYVFVRSTMTLSSYFDMNMDSVDNEVDCTIVHILQILLVFSSLKSVGFLIIPENISSLLIL